MKIKIGTRGSKLALIQAKIVEEKLKNLGYESELLIITTSGDKEKNKPLYDMGGKALFIKELEEALLRNEIDIAVHSLKDVPGVMPKGFKISAMLEREDPRDVLISKYKNIMELPTNAKVGSSSPRRIIYIKQLRPDVEIVNIRGNVDTRYNRVANNEIDATILAYAGLKRLGGYLDSGLCHPISVSKMIPAIGQGVIAIEIRECDDKMLEISKKINHQMTWNLMQAERSFLEHSFSTCRSPVAAFAQEESENMNVEFMLADDDWTKFVTHSESCTMDKGYELGKRVAENMKKELLLHITRS